LPSRALSNANNLSDGRNAIKEVVFNTVLSRAIASTVSFDSNSL